MLILYLPYFLASYGINHYNLIFLHLVLITALLIIRKRVAGEVGGVKLNDSQKRKPKNARPFEQRLNDVAPGKDSTSCRHQTEAIAAGLNNLATPKDSQAQIEDAAAVSENPGPTGDSHPQKVKLSFSCL